MTVPTLKPTGEAAVQVELLTRLGLPASASPEDIDELHQAASDFLAAAPPEIRGWARAQVAALDAAYIALTDPVGLEGSALMSPASPPTVVPGGPATPPARRGPALAVIPDEPVAETNDDEDLEIEGEPDVEDLAALYAMVTPSAHDDMRPQAKPARPAAPAARPARAPSRAASPALAIAPAQPNVWKGLFLGLVGIAAVVATLFGVNALVNGAPGASPAASAVAQATPGAPSVDMNKIGTLMEQLNANPEDVDTLLALGNEYYNGQEFEAAAGWFEKILAIDPDNIQALLALGAVDFNLGNTAAAETGWKRVLELDSTNVEAYYDLGFMAFYQAQPDYDAVQAYWGKVIELDPDSPVGQQVQTHLDALIMRSMIPAPSTGAEASPGASPESSSEAASPVAASPAASAATSPAASTTP